MPSPQFVSVCICTYRRPEQLALLLADLAAQTRLPQEVVVVDNDPAGSGRPSVEAARATVPFALRYDIQPVKNISLTRNATVALATGDWLGFLDDDERVQPDWLAQFCDAVERYGADGALAPVVAIVPPEAPAWIRRGNFYQVIPRTPTGQIMPLNRIGIGNAFLRADRVRALEGPFDPALGLTGGEDSETLTRLVQAGAKLVACDEATATEPVAAARLQLHWILLRSLRGGHDYASHRLAGRFGPLRPWSRPLLYLDATAKLVAALGIALLTLPLGRHRAARGLQLAASNLGKLSTLSRWRYQEYAAPKH